MTRKIFKKKILEYEVPEKLIDAFTGFYLEYIENHHSCVNKNGPFAFMDLHQGIYEKICSVFWPIRERLGVMFPDLFFSIIIDASINDHSNCLIIVENKYGGKLLTTPIVAFHFICKAWHFIFNQNPAETYQELASYFYASVNTIKKALKN